MNHLGNIPPIHLDPDNVPKCAKCGKPMDIGYVSPDGSNWWCRNCLPSDNQTWISEIERQRK